MTEPVDLEWCGPLTFGCLPNTKEELDALRICAIYIFFRCYEGFKGKTLVYVGKTENLSKRLAMHYSDFLGCVATLYKEDGTVFRDGWAYEYFRSIQENLNETLRYAVADAKRTRFVYVPFKDNTQIKTVEATIIWRLRKLSPESFINWNTTCQRDLVGYFPLQNKYSSLKVDSFASEELDRLHMIFSACHED